MLGAACGCVDDRRLAASFGMIRGRLRLHRGGRLDLRARCVLASDLSSAGCAAVFFAALARRRAAFFDRRHDFADLHLGAGRHLDPQRARLFRGDLRGDLVRLQREQRVAGCHGVAVVFVPGGKQAAGDGFADGGDFDFESSWERIRSRQSARTLTSGVQRGAIAFCPKRAIQAARQRRNPKCSLRVNSEGEGVLDDELSARACARRGEPTAGLALARAAGVPDAAFREEFAAVARR